MDHLKTLWARPTALEEVRRTEDEGEEGEREGRVVGGREGSVGGGG